MDTQTCIITAAYKDLDIETLAYRHQKALKRKRETPAQLLERSELWLALCTARVLKRWKAEGINETAETREMAEDYVLAETARRVPTTRLIAARLAWAARNRAVPLSRRRLERSVLVKSPATSPDWRAAGTDQPSLPVAPGPFLEPP